MQRAPRDVENCDSWGLSIVFRTPPIDLLWRRHEPLSTPHSQGPSRCPPLPLVRPDQGGRARWPVDCRSPPTRRTAGEPSIGTGRHPEAPPGHSGRDRRPPRHSVAPHVHRRGCAHLPQHGRCREVERFCTRGGESAPWFVQNRPCLSRSRAPHCGCRRRKASPPTSRRRLPDAIDSAPDTRTGLAFIERWSLGPTRRGAAALLFLRRPAPSVRGVWRGGGGFRCPRPGRRAAGRGGAGRRCR